MINEVRLIYLPPLNRSLALRQKIQQSKNRSVISKYVTRPPVNAESGHRGRDAEIDTNAKSNEKYYR